MIKNCNILINNEAVTVIEYDGKKIQIPSIHRKATTVKVVKKGNKCIVVDDDYKEPAQKVAAKSQKRSNKKTTIDKDADEAIDTQEKSIDFDE